MSSSPRPHKHRRLSPTEPPVHALLTLPSDVWEIVCALVADNPGWLFATWSLVCPLASKVVRPVKFAALRLNSDGAAVPAACWQQWQEITQLTITGASAARILSAVRAGLTRVQTLLLKSEITAQDLREAVHLKGLRALGHDIPKTQASDFDPTLVPCADWLNLCQPVDNDALAQYLRAPRTHPLHTLVLKWRPLTTSLCDAVSSNTELRQLEMRGCNSATFGWLAALTKLRYLDLRLCTRVSDATLVSLSALSTLQVLSLQNCDHVTMDGLASLSRLRNLRYLHLAYLPQLTGLSFLAEMSELTGLHVYTCNLNNAALEALRNFTCAPNLRYLSLGYLPQLTSLSFLTEMSELTRLHVQHCNLNNAALEALGNLRQLQVLSLMGNKLITDAGLGHLSALHQLTLLDLRFCRGINGSGLGCLADLPELRSLSLEGCSTMTNVGARPLPPKLQNLNFVFCRALRDEALEQIAHLAHLQQLDLSGCRLLTSAGLQYLAKLRSLQKLTLFFCSGIQDFKSLSGLKALTQLSLQGCKVTDSQLAYLPSNLRSLNLGSNESLSDKAFMYLSSLGDLQTLDIRECPALTQRAVLDFKTQRPRVVLA